MINIGRASQHFRAATLERLATGPMIAAQAQASRQQGDRRGEGMPLAEAERVVANLKARSARLEQEHQAQMRRIRGDEDYTPMPPVDAITHDLASVFVQAEMGQYERQERAAVRAELGDVMHFCHDRGMPLPITIRIAR